jgi:hypothetical protein
VATVGDDGLALLAALVAPQAPAQLHDLPPVALLRSVWDQQSDASAGRARLREPKELPPATDQVETPHDPEARDGLKRGRGWTGDKVHVTETCDDWPHLITDVATTRAPAAEVEQFASIEGDPAHNDPTPAPHPVDAGYVRGRTPVTSRELHGIDLIGPGTGLPSGTSASTGRRTPRPVRATGAACGGARPTPRGAER